MPLSVIDRFWDGLHDARWEIQIKKDKFLYKKALANATEAILLLHTSGEDGQKPILHFTRGFLDFGKYEAGSIFRVNHVSGKTGQEWRTFSWYVVGEPGKNAKIYCLSNYPPTEIEMRRPQSPVLKLYPNWRLDLVHKPEVTAFDMEHAQTALSGQLLDPPSKHILEFQKKNPDKVTRVESIDLMSGGILEQRGEVHREALGATLRAAFSR